VRWTADRLELAAQAVGPAQGGVEETVTSTRSTRKAFGKKYQRISGHPWDDCRHADGNRSGPGWVYYAARLKDRIRRGWAQALRKPSSTPRNGEPRVYKAVQVHGSVGYSRETDVERMYRDAA